MTSPYSYADHRTVCIPDPLWIALQLVAEVSRTSISEELRRAAEAHVARYGLTILDGEMVRNPTLWPQAEISPGDR